MDSAGSLGTASPVGSQSDISQCGTRSKLMGRLTWADIIFLKQAAVWIIAAPFVAVGLLWLGHEARWLGREFRSHLFVSFGLGLFLVVAAAAFRYFGLAIVLSDREIAETKKGALAWGIALACLYLSNYGFVRNKVEEAYYEWLAGFGLWVFEWLYILARIALPFVVNVMFCAVEEQRRILRLRQSSGTQGGSSAAKASAQESVRAQGASNL